MAQPMDGEPRSDTIEIEVVVEDDPSAERPPEAETEPPHFEHPEDAVKALNEAIRGRNYQQVEAIYSWLHKNAINQIESHHMISCVRAARYNGRYDTAITFGESVFDHFIGPMRDPKTRRALQPMQWILFFRQLDEILAQILYASYFAQGRDQLPDLERWIKKLGEAEGFFSEILKPLLQENQEISLLAAIHERDIDFRKWRLRLREREWFFSQRADRRTAVETDCSVLQADIKKLADPDVHSDQQDKRVAEMLARKPQRLNLAIFEAQRALAQIECRGYESAPLPAPKPGESALDDHEEPNFHLEDEDLTLTCLHESEPIKKQIESGVKRCAWVIKKGEQMGQRRTLDDDVREDLEYQLLGASMRLNENEPKLGNFEAGYHAFQKACTEAQRMKEDNLQAAIINDYAYQNLLRLAKLLLKYPHNESLKAAAKNLHGTIRAERLTEEMDFPRFFLAEVIRISQIAKKKTKDPGTLRNIDDTMMEAALTIAEIPPGDHVTREKLDEKKIMLELARDLTLASVQRAPRVDRKNPKRWAYKESDALMRCLEIAGDLKRAAEQIFSGDTTRAQSYNINIELPLPDEAFQNARYLIAEALCEERDSRCPPGYLKGLKRKRKRLLWTG